MLRLLLLFLPAALIAGELEVISWSPRIFQIENFLTPEECDHIISLAEGKMERSLVVAKKSNSGAVDKQRTSSGMFLSNPSTDPIIISLEKRLSRLTHLPQENGEPIQILNYQESQQYRPHYDYFSAKTAGGKACLKRGGQRVATAIIYLADTEEGGETIFPKAEIDVKARKGNLMLFYSCTPDGETDPQSLHGGAPVLKGEKWILTKWYRQRSYQSR